MVRPVSRIKLDEDSLQGGGSKGANGFIAGTCHVLFLQFEKLKVGVAEVGHKRADRKHAGDRLKQQYGMGRGKAGARHGARQGQEGELLAFQHPDIL
jgi:hypothetical protein